MCVGEKLKINFIIFPKTAKSVLCKVKKNFETLTPGVHSIKATLWWTKVVPSNDIFQEPTLFHSHSTVWGAQMYRFFMAKSAKWLGPWSAQNTKLTAKPYSDIIKKSFCYRCVQFLWVSVHYSLHQKLFREGEEKGKFSLLRTPKIRKLKILNFFGGCIIRFLAHFDTFWEIKIKISRF